MKCFLYAFSLFVVVLPATLCAAEIQGKVIRVLDGDTIEVLQDKSPSGFAWQTSMHRKRNRLSGAGQPISLKAWLQRCPSR